MTDLFGTDGIRAPFGTAPLDRDTVTVLGSVLAETLAAPAPHVVVGGDTRDSTTTIAGWLAAGLAAGGARPRWLGVLPTPGVSWLTARLGAAAGVSVSASHNPHPDNGIKLIDARGGKWTTAAEGEIARLLAERLAIAPRPSPPPALVPDLDAVAQYLDALAGSVGGDGALAGLRLVIDAAHGAASPWVEGLFRRLGARVTVLSAQPDGRNINRGCGSTHPQAMAAATVARGADLGVAFDGDADRAILADENGEVRDGDAILYLWARALHRAGGLEPAAVVATSMSNLGLEHALAPEGIAVVRCDVGDRAVVETMRARGIRLGGEQSGHVVDLDLSPTGDGLLTALQICALRARAGEPLSALLAGFRRYPQLLRNVPVRRKEEFGRLPRVAAAMATVAERLGGDGRLVLRYSGTEPLARIMLEGPELGLLEQLAGELETAIAAEVGRR